MCAREKARVFVIYTLVHTLVEIASRALMKGPFSLVLHVKRASCGMLMQ
jgi:hypothetical protein